MRVSVIIPAYNAEQWIARSIESVLHQTVPAAEILVIDDGSVDGTARVVHTYAPAVRYLFQENGGVSVALNRGIQESTQEWVGILAADDEWMPDFIETHQALLQRTPHLCWSHCYGECVQHGRRWSAPIPEDIRQQLEQHGSIPFFLAASKGLDTGACGFLIHRAVFDVVGVFDTTMRNGQDMDLWSRIGMRYPVIAYSPKVCWRYHQDNPESLHKTGLRSRDAPLRSICRNMRAALALGPETADSFYPYARAKALDFMLRAAGKEAGIAPETISEARDLFPLTWRERVLLGGLALLPGHLARRVAHRFIE